MTRVLVIPPDAPAYVTDLTPNLATLQHLVGGNIEAVSGGGWHAYINDEGKYAEPILVNEVATRLFARVLHPGDFIAGTAIILGDTPDGDEADAPDRIITQIGATRH